MRLRSLDLLLIGFWAVAINLTLPFESTVPGFVRALTGVVVLVSSIYTLYALITALLYEKFDPAFRLAMALGVFIAVTLCIGLILNFLPSGITRPLWIFGYSIVTLILLAITQGVRNASSPQASRVGLLKPSQTLMLVLIVALFALSYAVARVGLTVQPRAGFTEFYLLRAETAPGVLLNVGVNSRENEIERYRLELISADTVIQVWDNIELAPNGEWQTTVDLPEAGIIYPISGLLYRAGETEAYRRVEFWLNREQE